MTYYAYGRLYHKCEGIKNHDEGRSWTLCKMELYTWDGYWRMDIVDMDDKFVARFELFDFCPFCGARLKDVDEKELKKRYEVLGR